MRDHSTQYRTTPIPRACAVAGTFALLAIASLEASAGREVRFTGPLVTSGPPLPQGMLAVEPYLVNTQVVGYYDDKRNRHDIDDMSQGWSVVVPMQYGVSERFTLGATPSAGLAYTVDGGRSFRIGDTGLSLSYLLAQSEGPSAAALAVAIRQNLTTGTYDHLDREGLADATGLGAPIIRLALYGQSYFLPDRNLRARVNLSWRLPGARASIDGASAYGTPAGFSGHAELGNAFEAALGMEYSLSTNWVLSADLLYERDRGANVRGVVASHGDALRFDRDITAWWRQSVAPAVEYHWSDRVGLIIGAVVSFDGRNSAAIVSPQIALNMVF